MSWRVRAAAVLTACGAWLVLSTPAEAATETTTEVPASAALWFIGRCFWAPRAGVALRRE